LDETTGDTMSKLRSECVTVYGTEPLPDETALYLIRDSVARRRLLIFGRLDDEYGHHCAIGAFLADNPWAVLHPSLVDEVAAVNDSIPKAATAHER
jgi:hypothetical protein